MEKINVNNMHYQVPILLVTFNRPEHTRKLLTEIRKQQPKQLFIFQDGARVLVESDKEKCLQVREVIAELVDWPCELKTFYSDENLGCGLGPATAITWFFQHVEQGIIIEDDCLLSDSAWRYYEDLLTQYKDNRQIGMIVAANLRKKWKSKDQSYHFSKVGGAAYGSFATWRRAWDFFDLSMSTWSISKIAIQANLGNDLYYNYFEKSFDNYQKQEKPDAWDYQWLYALLLNKFLVIVPSVNMLTNYGFGEGATHTICEQDQTANMFLYEINFPLKHNQSIKVDKIYDWVMFNKFRIGKKTIFKRILLKAIEAIFCK